MFSEHDQKLIDYGKAEGYCEGLKYSLDLIGEVINNLREEHHRASNKLVLASVEMTPVFSSTKKEREVTS